LGITAAIKACQQLANMSAAASALGITAASKAHQELEKHVGS
jgi:hypothetical protein